MILEANRFRLWICWGLDFSRDIMLTFIPVTQPHGKK